MSSTPASPALDDASAIVRRFWAHPFHTDADLLALGVCAGRQLWSVEDTGVLRHWDLAAQRQLGWHHLEELANLWCFRADGRFVAAGSDELTLWDVQTGEPPPDLATDGMDHGTGHSSDARIDRHRPRHPPVHRQTCRGAAEGGPVRFSRNGVNKSASSKAWCACGIAKSRHRFTSSAPTDRLLATLAFSLDGTKLATAGEDKIIQLWDLQQGIACGSLVGHTDRIPALAWHPDGKRLVSAGWDTTARVWNVQTWNRSSCSTVTRRRFRPWGSIPTVPGWPALIRPMRFTSGT